MARIDEYKDNLLGAIAALEGKLHDFMNCFATRAASVDHDNADSNFLKKERIPKMDVTTFDGNPINWEEFWDDFKQTVDDRSDLSVVTKFKLLRKSLVGKASTLCKGYPLTAANYDQAKSILEERYGDKEMGITLHLEALVQLKPATSHTISELTRIRDQCEAHIRALVILGFAEDAYGKLFAPIILSKLPKFVRLDIRKQKKLSKDKEWSMNMLREALTTEIELRAFNEHEYFGHDNDGDSSSHKNKPKNDKVGRFNNGKKFGTASTLFVNDDRKVPSKGQGQNASRQCAFYGGMLSHVKTR